MALPDPASEFESLRRQALADAWDEGARRVVDWNKAYPLVMPTDNPYRDKTPNTFTVTTGGEELIIRWVSHTKLTKPTEQETP